MDDPRLTCQQPIRCDAICAGCAALSENFREHAEADRRTMKEHATQLLRMAWPVVMVAGGLIVWGARLELQVGQKADRETVLGLESRVMNELNDVSVQMERVERMMTRLVCAQNPGDMSCP